MVLWTRSSIKQIYILQELLPELSKESTHPLYYAVMACLNIVNILCLIEIGVIHIALKYYFKKIMYKIIIFITSFITY